jgi:anti-anti-sigma factor
MKSDLKLQGERLDLAGDLDIYNAARLKSSLMDALASQRVLQLDLSAVSSIDAAGLQVLALLHREAGRAGKSLRIAGGNQTVLHFIDTVGMHNFFGDALAPTLINGGREAAA